VRGRASDHADRGTTARFRLPHGGLEGQAHVCARVAVGNREDVERVYLRDLARQPERGVSQTSTQAPSIAALRQTRAQSLFLVWRLCATANADALNIYVHLDDRVAERPLDGELHGVGNAARDLGYARAVLDDDE
jgi:hypothetical protein